MTTYDDAYLDTELLELTKDARSPEIRKAWRKLATKGMISALGEYTPVELVALIDYIDELEQKLNDAPNCEEK